MRLMRRMSPPTLHSELLLEPNFSYSMSSHGVVSKYGAYFWLCATHTHTHTHSALSTESRAQSAHCASVSELKRNLLEHLSPQLNWATINCTARWATSSDSAVASSAIRLPPTKHSSGSCQAKLVIVVAKVKAVPAGVLHKLKNGLTAPALPAARALLQTPHTGRALCLLEAFLTNPARSSHSMPA